ncbi:MAG: hypothetical protein AMXMBFR84_15030 [Candidatus Hydrogenedentota bacterium]
MRICRFLKNSQPSFGYYYDDTVVPLSDASGAYKAKAGRDADLSATEIMELLPGGAKADVAHAVSAWLDANPAEKQALSVPVDGITLQSPIPSPGKILLLAGNYVEHIKEGGEAEVEREETFPYVFMKPVTTVNHPNAPVLIPRVSPDHIDYECELAVVIGKTCKHANEGNALDFVAGYTVVNDISDRVYRPFPNRKKRERDPFFDWLHGKWHDGFCPIGPCVTSAKAIPDPQTLGLKLTVNGEIRQNALTAQMVFPVAAVIAFITQSVTLHAGDIISTGTPSGVAMATGRYLKNGDVIEASVDGIGTLRNTMGKE